MDYTILLIHNFLVLFTLGSALLSYHRGNIAYYWICRASCTLLGLFLFLNAAILMEYRSIPADFLALAISWRYMSKMKTRILPSKIKDDNLLDTEF
jgi:hypothetical protein